MNNDPVHREATSGFGNSYDYTQARRGVTEAGLNHLYANQAKIFDAVSALDSAGIAARAKQDAERCSSLAAAAGESAKTAAAAAELTASVQPVVDAMAALQAQLQRMEAKQQEQDAKLDAIQSNKCCVMQ